MPKCGQLRVGAAWVGGKEPDLLPNGNLRFYDNRMRTRIMLGAIVRGQIAKNSIFRFAPGNGHCGTKKGARYQQHYKYYSNKGAPGSTAAAWQAVFKQAMDEVKNLTEEQRAPYKARLDAYFASTWGKGRPHKGRCWQNFYLTDRLKELYPGYP